MSVTERLRKQETEMAFGGRNVEAVGDVSQDNFKGMEGINGD